MSPLDPTLARESAAPAPPAASGAPRGRDHRVDFFRGLALLVIFVDHIPENVLGLFTLRSFGFSDAAEIFIFLSGYSAGFVFGVRDRRGGFAHAALELLRRVWTLYVVHIVVFVLFVAQVSFSATRFGNPIYIEEMNMRDFLDAPHVAVIEALLLRFQPRFLDILPLYIVLLLGVIPLMALVRRALWPCLALSGLAWLGVQFLGWHPTAYPDDREWTYNPLAWQFLFVIGVAIGVAAERGGAPVPRPRWAIPLVVAFLGFALAVSLSWTLAGLRPGFPRLLATALWPLDKTDLSAWRLMHFLALAWCVGWLTQGRERWFAGPLARPLVSCGRHAIDVFCLGIFLAFFGHLALQELGNGLFMQLAVNGAGCILMVGLAAMLDWYKSLSPERGGG